MLDWTKLPKYNNTVMIVIINIIIYNWVIIVNMATGNVIQLKHNAYEYGFYPHLMNIITNNKHFRNMFRFYKKFINNTR